MASANTPVAGITFIDLLVIILLGWILVPLWQRYIDNLTFNTLGLDKDSSYQTLIIALVGTVLFVVFTFSFDAVLNLGINDGTGGLVPPVPSSQQQSNTDNDDDQDN